MSFPPIKDCVIKQENCHECTKINRFGFCDYVLFDNSKAYCEKHSPCMCPYIWKIHSIWRDIIGE